MAVFGVRGEAIAYLPDRLSRFESCSGEHDGVDASQKALKCRDCKSLRRLNDFFHTRMTSIALSCFLESSTRSQTERPFRSPGAGSDTVKACHGSDFEAFCLRLRGFLLESTAGILSSYVCKSIILH